MAAYYYSVPLAPPAPPAPHYSPAQNSSSWKEWFSPQLIPSSRLRQQQRQQEYDDENDNDDSTQNSFQRRQSQQGRTRSSSFDLTPTRKNAARFQNQMSSDGGSMTAKSFNYSKSMPSSSHRDGPVQSSYLQTFLLRLNTVLPEYCMLLASTSEDTLRSIEEVSKAVNVMEKTFKLDHRTIARDNVDLPIPSSPTLQPSSSMPDPSSQMHSPSKFDHWSLKWNSKAELEWSRFTQPFLNLVGAECLYAAMEHMLDPSLSPTEMNISSKDLKGVKVPLGRAGGRGVTKSIPPPPPLFSATSVDTSKRGSRRLIAIYRQVRDELVVVGEYLCDPVLLASSVTRDHATDALTVSGECNPALELRTILDALISFIDSRVILVRINAEICNVKTPSSVNLLKDRDSQVTKLKALAEQCQSAVTNDDKVGCVTQRVVSNVTKELKCMQLILTSIGNLLECDFFNCVLNVRRLHIHMTQIAYQRCLPMLYIQHCLSELMAMMHIYFAHFAGKEMMHLNSISTSSTSIQSTLSMGVEFNKFTDFASLFSEFINANINTDTPLTNALVQGFIDVNIASHLAVALVHRSKRAVQYSSFEERQQNNDAIESMQLDMWTTLYMKCGKDEYWPDNDWAQIEAVLTKHCSTPGVTNDPVKHTIVSAMGGNIGSSRQSVFCHIAAINDSICLIVIQGASGQTKMHQRDKEIQPFLRSMATKLTPENLLSVRTLSEIKLKLFATVIEDKDRSRHRNSNVQVSSLWSETDWSVDHGNKVLHSLGLRKKSSPVIAPLTSPYVNRKMRQLGEKLRTKSLKKSMNHGHLDFFLGSQLSKLPIPS